MSFVTERLRKKGRKYTEINYAILQNVLISRLEYGKKLDRKDARRKWVSKGKYQNISLLSMVPMKKLIIHGLLSLQLTLPVDLCKED